mgnify:CR=1 FL=1
MSVLFATRLKVENQTLALAERSTLLLSNSRSSPRSNSAGHLMFISTTDIDSNPTWIGFKYTAFPLLNKHKCLIFVDVGAYIRVIFLSRRYYVNVV